VIRRPQGLYCPQGDFYIDPWRPVDRAIITHAHADHARTGHGHYLASAQGEQVLRTRLGEINLQTLAYGQTLDHNGVKISLHPAGHVLGSAQVRLQWRDEVWVVSGDYKLDADPTCTPFEPVVCHTFITESTFGLPVYRWPDPATVMQQINDWWAQNAANQRTSDAKCHANQCHGLSARLGASAARGGWQYLDAPVWTGLGCHGQWLDACSWRSPSSQR